MVAPEEKSRIAILLAINGGLLIAIILAAITKVDVHIEIKVESNDTVKSQTSSRSNDKSWLTVLKSPLPYDEAVDHCQLKQKKLPTPNSQQEEDELVEELLRLNYSSEDCASYHLGYKASLNKRYIKLNSHIHVPSLEIRFDTAKPTANEQCIGIQKDFCVDVISCKNITGRCFLKAYILDVDMHSYCTNDIYATICWELDVMNSSMSPIEYLKQKNREMDTVGLLPLSENIPLKVKNFLQSAETSKCPGQYLAIGVGSAIDLEYYKVASRREVLKYKSNRLQITDPNYNCLVVNAQEDYMLTTESCLRPACVICA